MKVILYLVGGAFLANIIAATFIWPPEEKRTGPLRPVINDATRQGQDPWMMTERYNAPFRDFLRGEMLKMLDGPWSNHCTADGHRMLVGGINNYYDQRTRQIRTYAEAFGAEARRFSIKAWSSTDDQRIWRLIGETYERGYIAADEIKGVARNDMAELIKQKHITAKPCSS